MDESGMPHTKLEVNAQDQQELTPQEREHLYAILRRRAKYLSEYQQLSKNKFIDPVGYLPYEELVERIGIFLMTNANATLLHLQGMTALPDPMLRSITIILYAAQTSAPVYWLKDALCAALQQTKLPKHLTDIKRVVPCGVLLLPPGLMTLDEEPIEFILWEHWEAGETRPQLDCSQGVTVEKHQFEQDTIAWSYITSTGAYGAGITEVNRPESESGIEYSEISMEGLPEALQADEEETKQAAFVQKISNFVLQLVLLMQVMPELIEPQPPATLVRFGRKNRKSEQRFAPRWIGQTYSVASEDTTTPSRPQADSPADLDASTSTASTRRESPRTHWRKGHWRRVVWGKLSEGTRKWNWFQPVLVRPPHVSVPSSESPKSSDLQKKSKQ
jgi:hypothetical protein